MGRLQVALSAPVHQLCVGSASGFSAPTVEYLLHLVISPTLYSVSVWSYEINFGVCQTKTAAQLPPVFLPNLETPVMFLTGGTGQWMLSSYWPLEDPGWP